MLLVRLVEWPPLDRRSCGATELQIETVRSLGSLSVALVAVADNRASDAVLVEKVGV